MPDGGGVGPAEAIAGEGGGAALPGADRIGDLLRADFHAHTLYSEDAVMSPAELLDRARRAGLDRIAVTDHGTIEGALAARRLEHVQSFGAKAGRRLLDTVPLARPIPPLGRRRARASSS